MSMLETWSDYLRRITRGLDRNEIAAAAGINTSTVSRWIRDANVPSSEKVINLARNLHQSPVEALVKAGYLEDTDIKGSVEIVQSLAALSDDALIDELASRLRDRLTRSGDQPKPWPPVQWQRPPDELGDVRPQQG